MATWPIKNLDGAKTINSETYTMQTYNFLRSAILTHDLKENEIYSQDQVSAMLNISRTPVREALLALQKEGYIRFLRGRGFEVVSFDDRDLKDIFEVRLIVETAAAGMAAKRATEQHLDILKRNVEIQQTYATSTEQQTIQNYLQLDDEFHRQILEASGNQRLLKVTEDMRNQLVRTGYEILQFGENGLVIYNEHQIILKAIEERNFSAAEQAMASHINNTQARSIAQKKSPL